MPDNYSLKRNCWNWPRSVMALTVGAAWAAFGSFEHGPDCRNGVRWPDLSLVALEGRGSVVRDINGKEYLDRQLRPDVRMLVGGRIICPQALGRTDYI